jgi:AraC-like DNA-binding protein
MKDFPICHALGQHGILHVGVAKTSAPVDFPPMGQNSTCFLACLGGEGRIQAESHSYACPAGTACLLPSDTLNVFPDAGRKPWEFCWACYVAASGPQPVSAETESIELEPFDLQPLRCAIEGLAWECGGQGGPAVIQHWVDLIQSYVTQFVHSRDDDHDEVLTLLWERVITALDADWNLARLSREAGYSYGHLRRLCRRQFGRSPMHQVAYLRMRRAAELLATTDYKLDAVAQAVGYANPFVFSNAFTRWAGWRPSDYRRKNNRLMVTGT